MASPGAYNSNQVATPEDYVMTSLASSRPGQAKSSAPPTTTRTSTAETESTSAVIYGPRNALSPSGGGSGQAQFLLYYCYGELVVRPVGLFTGDIASEYARVVPYLLRRSNGQIRWLQYDSSDYLMVSDLKMVMEVDVALQNTANIIIKARENAQVYVYGEVAGGFSFGADSKLELIGFLYFAKWTKSGLGEEAINRSCIIDFTDGVANVFLCDYKEAVLMVDDNVKYQLILHEDEVDAQMTAPPEQLSPSSAKPESIPVPRLDLVPRPQTESVKPKVVTPTKVSSSSVVPPITTQERVTFADIVKRMDEKNTNPFEEQEKLQSRRKSTAKVSKAQVKDIKKSAEVVAPKDVIISKSIQVVDNPKAIEVLRKVSDRFLPSPQKDVKKGSTTSHDGTSKRSKSKTKSPVESKVASPKSKTTTSVSASRKVSPMVTVIRSPGPSKPITPPTNPTHTVGRIKSSPIPKLRKTESLLKPHSSRTSKKDVKSPVSSSKTPKKESKDKSETESWTYVSESSSTKATSTEKKQKPNSSQDSRVVTPTKAASDSSAKKSKEKDRVDKPKSSQVKPSSKPNKPDKVNSPKESKSKSEQKTVSTKSDGVKSSSKHHKTPRSKSRSPRTKSVSRHSPTETSKVAKPESKSPSKPTSRKSTTKSSSSTIRSEDSKINDSPSSVKSIMTGEQNTFSIPVISKSIDSATKSPKKHSSKTSVQKAKTPRSKSPSKAKSKSDSESANYRAIKMSKMAPEIKRPAIKVNYPGVQGPDYGSRVRVFSGKSPSKSASKPSPQSPLSPSSAAPSTSESSGSSPTPSPKPSPPSFGASAEQQQTSPKSRKQSADNATSSLAQAKDKIKTAKLTKTDEKVKKQSSPKGITEQAITPTISADEFEKKANSKGGQRQKNKEMIESFLSDQKSKRNQSKSKDADLPRKPRSVSETMLPRSTNSGTRPSSKSNVKSQGSLKSDKNQPNEPSSSYTITSSKGFTPSPPSNSWDSNKSLSVSPVLAPKDKKTPSKSKSPSNYSKQQPKPSSKGSLKSNTSSGSRVRRSQMQKALAKLELEQLIKELNSTKGRMSHISASHFSSIEDQSEESTKELSANLGKEVEALKAKATRVIAMLHKMVNEIVCTLKAELMEHVEKMRQCSDQMTHEQFEQYAEQLTQLAHKIDQLLGQ